MALTSGTKLGPYEIQSLLGAGGMGEVYRARDSRLNRDVAIKVLPAIFAADSERMARFQREAQLLASLNHANIASIYGFEEKDGIRALVMELVEGPTLATRIGSGPIPIEDALPIARQIAEALESAHEKGIIHRDLKPANVKLSPDGTVKVLDFGLAKALDTADSNLSDPANSPTFTAATKVGVILGTAAYMSPEQAKGRVVDRRTDIWAFGCVLYEMLTGKPTFTGETITDTLAAVVRAEPGWDLLPKNTPLTIRELLRRCLQKDPKERLRDIGDVRIELKQLLSGSGTGVALALPEFSGARGKWARRLPWAVGTVALAAVAMWLGMKFHVPAHAAVTRFAITMPHFDEFGEIAISPDGSEIVFDTLLGGTGSQFYLRRLNQLTATPIAGTEQSDYPSFSPDGKWLAFIGNAGLMKARLDSGTTQTIFPNTRALGLSWADDNTIIFSQLGIGIFRVSAAGGTPELVAPIGPQTGNRNYLTPSILPGGKFAIVTLGLSVGAAASTEDVAVVRVDQPGTVPAPRILLQAARLGRYAYPGFIFFTRGESLFAAPFDLAQQKITGNPTPVLEKVKVNPAGRGGWYFDLSSSGTLVYSPPVGQNRVPVLVSRNGEEQPLDVPARSYFDPQLSPDGKRLALSIDLSTDHQNQNIWVYGLERHTWIRLGFDEREEVSPVWAPDGRRLFFVTLRGAVFSKLADGSNAEQQIYKFSDLLFLTSITPDGRTLLGEQLRKNLGFDVVMLHLKDDAGLGQVDGDSVPLISSPATEWRAQFSPDGHWIAYVSNETGSSEVYVQAYPGAGGKWQVSTDGGDEPRWSGSGHELFYRHGDAMMAVDVKASPTFSSGTPHILFKGQYETPGGVQNYAVTPDGQRFVMLKKQSDSSPPEIDVVLNWAEELQK